MSTHVKIIFGLEILEFGMKQELSVVVWRCVKVRGSGGVATAFMLLPLNQPTERRVCDFREQFRQMKMDWTREP